MKSCPYVHKSPYAWWLRGYALDPLELEDEHDPNQRDDVLLAPSPMRAVAQITRELDRVVYREAELTVNGTDVGFPLF